MRKSKSTESQIVAVLREGEAGVPGAELLRKHGISRQTYFKWKAKCGDTSVPELRRLKELEQENARLRLNLAPPECTYDSSRCGSGRG